MSIQRAFRGEDLGVERERGSFYKEVTIAAGTNEIVLLPDAYESLLLDIVATGTTYQLYTTGASEALVNAGTATFYPVYDAEQSASNEEAFERGLHAVKLSNTGAGSVQLIVSGN